MLGFTQYLARSGKSTLKNSSEITGHLRIPVQPNLRPYKDVKFKYVERRIEDHNVPLSVGVINILEVE